VIDEILNESVSIVKLTEKIRVSRVLLLIKGIDLQDGFSWVDCQSGTDGKD